MRISSLIVAGCVIFSLYLVIFEREALLAFAAGGAPDSETVGSSDDTAATEDDTPAVPVVVLASTAQQIDQVVLLRGRTEAMRSVEARAETSGRVISEPLRKGAFVEAGDLLCEIDPGTREVSLSEAEARLAEARAALPAARARLAEAEAALPAAEAAIVEARTRVPEAEARLAEARASVPTAEARLLEAEANVPAAEAGLAQARAGIPAAEAGVAEARARVEEARINLNAAERLSDNGFASEVRLASARAASEAAKAGLQLALSQQEGAKATVQNALSAVEGAKAAVSAAKGQVESAKAAVQSAMSGVEAASAGVISAQSGLEGARAAIETAKSSIESANAGIESAEAAVAAARKEIDNLTISAPFAGLLETDTAELGSLLQPGSLCGTVIQLSPIKLVAFVPEAQVDKVELGAMAGARLASGGREVTGEVTFLSRSADTATRTFRVEIMVENENLTIRDGQTVEIAIRAAPQTAHLVPQSALTLDDEGTMGLRVLEEDNIVGFRPVEILRDSRDGLYVSGLADTADIIVVGQEFVIAGVRVKPTFREASQ
ncbi:MAG: efflux transporter periplasmic adaptor subunit [Maritimibacter sp.]|nr:efflux transporter periplasmic adaptor subunit [Maritimibacter sp.]